MMEATYTLAQLATLPAAAVVAGLVVQFVKAVGVDGDGRLWRRLSAITGLVAYAGAVIVSTVTAPVPPEAQELALAVGLAIVNGLGAGVLASKTYEATQVDVGNDTPTNP